MILYKQQNYDLFLKELEGQLGTGWSKEGFQEHIETIISLINNKKEARLLDVGCSVAGLKTMLPDYIDYTGVDVLGKYNDQANNIYRMNIFSKKFIEWERKFDLIFVRQAFQFFKNITIALIVLSDKLNEDGFLYIVQSLPYKMEKHHYSSMDNINDIIFNSSAELKIHSVDMVKQEKVIIFKKGLL